MEFVATGKPLNRIGNRHPFMTPFDVFQSADKDFRHLLRKRSSFAEALQSHGRPDLVTDNRFLSNQHRTENNAALKGELEAAFKEEPPRIG